MPSLKLGTPPSSHARSAGQPGGDTSPAPNSPTATRRGVLLWHWPWNGLPIGTRGYCRGHPGEAASGWGQVQLEWGALALQMSSDQGEGFSWQQEVSSLQGPSLQSLSLPLSVL